MNVKIKFRESFRPFAPAVLREHVHEWFELDGESPYMLLVADVQPSRRLPARPETENLWGNRQAELPRSTCRRSPTSITRRACRRCGAKRTRSTTTSSRRSQRTACPVIVNTSFNVRGEPIVGAPEDAYRCFMRTDMDVLVLENFVLEKSEQAPVVEDESWRKEFVLD
jgi:carbamoyltransferase